MKNKKKREREKAKSVLNLLTTNVFIYYNYKNDEVFPKPHIFQ